MKKLFFIGLFALSSQLIAQDESTEKEKICWSDSVAIEWTDFQAPAEEGKKIAALSSIGLPYKYITDGEGEMNVSVDVCFIKGESWYIKSQKNNLLLNHERLHFDIAELYRRKIIREIVKTEFTKKNYKAKLDKIVEKYWVDEYRKAQNLYDKETNFSRVVKAQIEWNEKIAKELKELQAYQQKVLEVSLINFD